MPEPRRIAAGPSARTARARRGAHAGGVRHQQAASPNLGDVFAAIGQRAKHVPYRNSKLTHLLAPCLGGDGKTLMLVNVAPEAEGAEESMHALQFAAKVNAVELGGGTRIPSQEKRHKRQRRKQQPRRGGARGGGQTREHVERSRQSVMPLPPGAWREHGRGETAGGTHRRGRRGEISPRKGHEEVNGWDGAARASRERARR